MNDAYDPATGFIHCTNGGKIRLKNVERRMFEALLKANGRPLTRNQLVDAAYGHLPDTSVPQDEYHAICTRKHDLAKKIVGCTGHIETIRDVGYRLVGKFDVMKPAAGNCPCCGQPMPEDSAITN